MYLNFTFYQQSVKRKLGLLYQQNHKDCRQSHLSVAVHLLPILLSQSLSQKNPYLLTEDRGLVSEVFSSVDRLPAPLWTRVSASPGRPGFALIGKQS